MGMTITEKILAKASGKRNIEVGDIVEADIDYILGTDVMMPLVFEILEEMDALKNMKKEKLIVVQDHFLPAPNIKAAEQSKIIREYCRRYDIRNYIEVGRGGVCHVVLPDRGFVAPGEVIVGSDSHTTTYGALGAFSTGLGSTDIAVATALGKLWFKVPPTIKINLEGNIPNFITGKDIILYILGKISASGARYKALEIGGSAIEQLSMEDRFTICNMGVEAGAKNTIIEADEKTIAYLKEVCNREYEILYSDVDAVYERTITIDCSNLEPQVAYPHSPDKVEAISGAKGIKVDQVYIGSCTNGRLKDLRITAEILKNKTIHSDVRLIVTPASQEIYLKSIDEGIARIIVEAGGIFNTPSCGACFGGHLGVLAGGEVCLSTTNRNFRGRMGSPDSKVYLASPAVAAATALAGEIADPREELKCL